ncbi:hypothetical protein [Candidatus Entotheonella palauensis]|uniref:Sensory transduction regulator n=1 Tax=Candidatus Entotheonella gemina TaxID=1429439 RepID=W4MAC6_9BACT|nr:hypothetical protein [Candidatus Entotheonella palauensis]ETX07155.1 MAG: hypothetical protein ETSY2_12870 [Candidatus Entotheonella gemina]
MSDIYERLCDFLDAAGLEPERQSGQLAQFWYKEERYYLRFLPPRQAIRIFHPRVWRVTSHLEFGVATFVANDMNQDSFAAKCFVNNDDHHVYAAVEVFAPDAETVQTSFFNYMNALSGSIVEFRDRTERSMQEEENQASPPPERT